jgi:hypothetical protein
MGTVSHDLVMDDTHRRPDEDDKHYRKRMLRNGRRFLRHLREVKELVKSEMASVKDGDTEAANDLADHIQAAIDGYPAADLGLDFGDSVPDDDSI